MSVRRRTAHCRLGALLAVMSLCACVATPSDPAALSWSAANPSAVAAWIDEELAPYLANSISRHPRFRGESIRVVSMNGDRLRSEPDELSREIIRRVETLLLDAGGIRLLRETQGFDDDCRRYDEPHYYLGIEVKQTGRSSHRVSVRALDLQDGSWVSNFALHWEGSLSPAESAAYRRHRSSDDSLGEREHPFSETQSDLLAQKLASDLHEVLCGFVGEPLTVHADAGNDLRIADKAVALVANYLARSPGISVVDEPARASLRLSGRLYRIDGDLHQFWILARPSDPDTRLRFTDLDAYVRLGEAAHPTVTPEADASPAARPAATAIDMRIVTPVSETLCRASDPWRDGATVLAADAALPRDGCYGIEIDARSATTVFLIGRSVAAEREGLMPASCQRYRYVTAGVDTHGTLRYTGRRHVIAATGRADTEQFYGVAVADSDAMTAIRRHLDDRDAYCDARRSPYGAPEDPARWLREFARIIDKMDGRAHWQSISVRHSS